MTKYIKEKFKGTKDQIALYIAENIEVSDISYSSNLDELQDTFKLGFSCDKNTFTLGTTNDNMLEITYNKPITLDTKISLVVNTYLSEGKPKISTLSDCSINDVLEETNYTGDDTLRDIGMYLVNEKGYMELIWDCENGLV